MAYVGVIKVAYRLVQISHYLNSHLRCITSNSMATVEVTLEQLACVELFKSLKDLGRFALRMGEHTVAAGIISEFF